MKHLLILFPFWLGACGEKSETEEIEAQTEETDSPEEAFLPQNGQWNISALSITEDSCNFEEEESSEEIASLSVEDDGSYLFVVGPDDGEALFFSCSLDEQTLNCDEYSQTEDQGGGTSFTYAYSVEVSFSSATEMSGSVTMALNCDGGDCDALEVELPCSISADFTGSAVEE